MITSLQNSHHLLPINVIFMFYIHIQSNKNKCKKVMKLIIISKLTGNPIIIWDGGRGVNHLIQFFKILILLPLLPLIQLHHQPSFFTHNPTSNNQTFESFPFFIQWSQILYLFLQASEIIELLSRQYLNDNIYCINLKLLFKFVKKWHIC